MYSKKFIYSSFINVAYSRPNLNVMDQNGVKCLCTFRPISLPEFSFKMNNLFTKLKIICKNRELLEHLLSKRAELTNKLKDHSTVIIRAWTRQCEYIVAQRFRRTQQMFCLYNRMWDEKALKELFRRIQQQFARKGKEFIYGAIGMSAFNWENQKIPDKVMLDQLEALDYIKILSEETLICKECHQRKLFDIMLPNRTYCKCPEATKVYTYDKWEPYLERKDLVVWRRKRKDANNFEYKLFGIYDDITAEDFLQVQVNTEYRQKWDNTAVNLFVVDSDNTSNSDIVYWEMLWPRMFTNRDYVYNRRYVIDDKSKIITIVSKSIKHPSCPEKPDKHRVEDYESCMVIHAHTDFNHPGIEFCLTYYDDPGVNIPSAVTSWVAIAGMPDFLEKQRNAAKEYRKYAPVETGHVENRDSPDLTPDDLPVLQMANSPDDSGGYWRYMHPYYFIG